MMPASSPSATAIPMNGRRMKLHDAPTSFIVLMEKRREKMPRRTVLLMSENDTTMSSTAITTITSATFCRLRFTLSIRSF